MKVIEKRYRVRGSWIARHASRFMGDTQSVGRYKRADAMLRFVQASNNGDGTWNVVVEVEPGTHRAVALFDGGRRKVAVAMYRRRDIRKPLKMLAVESKRAVARMTGGYEGFRSRDDFDCPHCGRRLLMSEHCGEEKTVGSLRTLFGLPEYPHVVCPGCGLCCGCLHEPLDD